jgi:LacI family transcriptional regulator
LLMLSKKCINFIPQNNIPIMDYNSNCNVRIKDIAELAGVSVGTVDRVLHGRPNVSAKSKQKVENVLHSIEYKPNMYASALATNRQYHFYCLLPEHREDSTWSEVEEGILTSVQQLVDFHVDIKCLYFDLFNDESFLAKGQEVIDAKADGIIIMPQEPEPTRILCGKFDNAHIPYTFVDTNYINLNPLAFFGQDPMRSGYFAAHIFMMASRGANEVFVFLPMSEGRVATKQIEYRQNGFLQYMKYNYPDCQIRQLNLTIEDHTENSRRFDDFFERYPNLRYGITFGSRAYLAGDYLAKKNRREIRIMGYDVLDRNIDCIRKGTISFLIGQHSWAQGFRCVRALFDHLVLHKEVNKLNYMPIELLSAENIDFYQKKLQ